MVTQPLNEKAVGEQPQQCETHTDSPTANPPISDPEKTTSSPPSSSYQPHEDTKPPVNPWMDPSQFPDGGTKAWLCVAGASACMFVSWGWINCIGVFQDYYMREPLKEYSPSTVAWIPSLETFFMLACSPVAGKLFDDYGPKVPLLIGTCMHVFGLMMASISTEYYQFLLAQGVCSAIGASLLVVPPVSSISTWFFKKRGMAIGLAAAGSSLGGVLFPIIVSHLIPQIGFGWAMRVCAFLVLTLMIFANLVLTSRLKPTKRPLSLRAFIRPLSESPMLMLTGAAFFIYWGLFAPFSFIVTVAHGRGMSLSLAQYLVSMLNAGSIFGRTLPGLMGDRLGRFNIMTLFCFMTTIVVLGLWIPARSNAANVAFAPLFGFSSGAAIGLTPALIAQISPIQEIGVRTGTMFAFGSIGALTGSPIGGALISRGHGDFLYMQLFAGVTCLVGAIAILGTRIKLGGFDIMRKV